MRNLLIVGVVVGVLAGCGSQGTSSAGGGQGGEAGQCGSGGDAGQGGGGAGGGGDCPAYCGPLPHDLPGRCQTASDKLGFAGAPPHTLVLQCPIGVEPSANAVLPNETPGCFSLTAYSPGLEAWACDGSGAAEVVWCCQDWSAAP